MQWDSGRRSDERITNLRPAADPTSAEVAAARAAAAAAVAWAKAAPKKHENAQAHTPFAVSAVASATANMPAGWAIGATVRRRRALFDNVTGIVRGAASSPVLWRVAVQVDWDDGTRRDERVAALVQI